MLYEICCNTHLRQHACPVLTDHLEDTETHFVQQGDWEHMSGPRRLILRFNQMLFGRLALGPAPTVRTVCRSELRRACSGGPSNGGIRLRHVPVAGLVLAWVVLACRLSVRAYTALFGSQLVADLAAFLCRTPSRTAQGSADRQRAGRSPRAGTSISATICMSSTTAVPNCPGTPSRRRSPHGGRDYSAEAGGHVYAGYMILPRRFLFRARRHPVHPDRRFADI